MALSANTPRTFEEGLEYGDFLVAASTTIYDGAIVGLSSGYARGLVAGDAFAGVAIQKRDNSTGAAGALKVRVRRRGYLVMNVTGASALTDKGKDVYASADDTLTLTQGSNSPVGKVHRWVSGTQCVVYFDVDLVSGDLPNHQHTAATDGGPLTSPRIVTSINDVNGNELLKVTAAGSAVNEFTLANAATGNGPSLAATGETNVDATIAAKGTGTLNLGQATGKVALATAATDYIGFYGTTPAQQPAHVADPAATATDPDALTAAALTVTDGAGTNDGTIPAITTGGTAADQAPVIAAIQELADQVNKIVADITSIRTQLVAAIDDIQANNTAIDSVLAQMATLGLQAAS